MYTYPFKKVPGFLCEVGWEVQFAFKNFVNGFFPVLSCKGGLEWKKKCVKKNYTSKLTRSKVNKLFDAKNNKYSYTIVRDLADKYKVLILYFIFKWFILCKNVKCTSFETIIFKINMAYTVITLKLYWKKYFNCWQWMKINCRNVFRLNYDKKNTKTIVSWPVFWNQN